MPRLIAPVLLGICCLSQGAAVAAADEVPFLLGTWHLEVGSCTETYRFAGDGRFEGSSGTEQLTGRYTAERLDGTVAVARIIQTIETDNLGTDCFGSAINTAGRSAALHVVLDASVTRMWLCLSATGERCIGPMTRVLPANEFGVEALLDWAERTYPGHFPGHAATQWQAPYQYRYYPATGNYVGVDGSEVYVLGPISQYAIQRVGTVEDFRCAVQKCVAARPSHASAGIGPR